MKKKFFALLVAVAMVFAMTACGSDNSAEDTSLADIQDNGVIKVGMCPEFPPFESINEDGDIEGFDADLAKAIGEIMGVDVEFVNTPYEGLIAGLQAGDFDIIMSGMSPEEAVEAGSDLNVSNNYYELAEVILTKDENIKTKDDLAGKKVGSHAGSTSEYAVDDLIGAGMELTSMPYNRHSEAFADLQNGNLDAQVVEDSWAKAKVTEDSGIIICEEPVTSYDIAAVMNSGTDSLLDAYNAALQELIDNGTYDEIVAKWFS